MKCQNTKQAVRAMRKAGWSVSPKPKTGELVCVEPRTGRRFLINARRKDMPRSLGVYLKQRGVGV